MTDKTWQISTKCGTKVSTPADINLMTPYILLEQEEWIEPETQFIQAFLQPGMQAIDIGACFGVYALQMAKAIGPQGQVFAFEPAFLPREHLQKSAQENSLDNLLIQSQGLSSSSGSAGLKNEGTPELSKFSDQTSAHSQEIQLITLDKWWQQADQPRIDLVKLDVNGYEAEVIQGGRKFLTQTSPVVIFSVKHNGQFDQQPAQALTSLGFDLYQYLPGPGILAGFDQNAQPEPYLLNLLAVKPETASSLQEKGLLAPEELQVPEPEPGTWQGYLSQLPWTASLLSAWQDKARTGKHQDYLRALDFLCAAQTPDTPRTQHLAQTKWSAQNLMQVYNQQASGPVALTLSRALQALGLRQQAVQVLNKLLQDIQSGQRMDFNLPFLPPLPRFDQLPIQESIQKWIMARCLESLLLLRSHSSYFSRAQDHKLIQALHNNPERTMEAQRRLILRAIRMGKNITIRPGSRLLTDEHLNKEVWSEIAGVEPGVQPSKQPELVPTSAPPLPKIKPDALSEDEAGYSDSALYSERSKIYSFTSQVMNRGHCEIYCTQNTPDIHLSDLKNLQGLQLILDDIYQKSIQHKACQRILLISENEIRNKRLPSWVNRNTFNYIFITRDKNSSEPVNTMGLSELLAARFFFQNNPDYPDIFDGSKPVPQIPISKGDGDKHQLLKKIHAHLQPELYLEIGVHHGHSLSLAKCTAIGIDPMPQVSVSLPQSAQIYKVTSDNFFAVHAPELLSNKPDLVLIDGMHLFEYVLRDFINVEKHSNPWTLVVIDDILPTHPVQAERLRRTPTWTGDVWKIFTVLEKYRPDLFLMPVNAAPTGFLLISGLENSNQVLQNHYDDIINKYVSDIEPPAKLIQRAEAVSTKDKAISKFLENLCQAKQEKISSDILTKKLSNDIIKPSLAIKQNETDQTYSTKELIQKAHQYSKHIKSKIQLDTVTLIAASSVDIEKHVLALYLSALKINFNKILFFTSEPIEPYLSGIFTEMEVINIAPLNSLVDYSRFIIKELHNYISTNHCLIVQSDGFVVNPDLWTDEFLKYDYVGAPWPKQVPLVSNGKISRMLDMTNTRVGNGGFSLRSKKLLETSSMIGFENLNTQSYSEDLIICHYLREKFESQGIKFAPVELAAKFSFELPIKEIERNHEHTFGFHGKNLSHLIISKFFDFANKKSNIKFTDGAIVQGHSELYNSHSIFYSSNLANGPVDKQKHPCLSVNTIVTGPNCKDIKTKFGHFISVRSPRGLYYISTVLKKFSNDYHPDIFLCHSDSTMQNLPTGLDVLNCKKIMFLGDTHHMHQPLQKLINYASFNEYDTYIAYCHKHHLHFFYERNSQKRFFFLPGYFTRFEANNFNSNKSVKVCFIGQTGKFHPYRTSILKYIQDRGVPLVIQTAPSEQASQIYANNLISLNISLNSDFNMRFFEVIAAGGFLLTDRLSTYTGYDLVFKDGRDFVFYDGPEDLCEKIDYYLKNPDEALQIARNGFETYHKHWNIHKRRQMFFDLVMEDKVHPVLAAFQDERFPAGQAEDRDFLAERIRQYEFIQELHRFGPLEVYLTPSVPEKHRLDILDLMRLNIITENWQKHVDKPKTMPRLLMISDDELLKGGLPGWYSPDKFDYVLFSRNTDQIGRPVNTKACSEVLRAKGLGLANKDYPEAFKINNHHKVTLKTNNQTSNISKRSYSNSSKNLMKIQEVPDLPIEAKSQSQFDLPDYKDLPKNVSFIASTPRSGSWFFGELLWQCGLGVPDEYFHRETHLPFLCSRWDLIKSNIIDLEEYILTCFRKRTTKDGNFLIKSHWRHQFEHFLKTDIIKKYFSGAKFCLITRKDILSQAISFEIACQTGQWLSFSPKSKEPIYSAKNIKSRMEDILRQNAHWKLFFAQNDIQFYEITYEELLLNTSSKIKEIVNFFVPNNGYNIDIDLEALKTKKIRNRINEQWKSKYIKDMSELNALSSNFRKRANT